MPRIRSIKPDFWDSADTARASLRTRLLYIAMWNWADDYGIGDATPLRLIGFAFPNDDIPVADYPRILSDVSGSFGVVYFQHCGRPFYVIPTWETHQRTEKRAKPREGLLKAAQDAITAAQDVVADNPRKVSDVPTHSGGSSGVGSRKREIGNRNINTLLNPDGSSDESNTTYPPAFEDFWQHYPRKVGKRKALTAWRQALKRATNEQLIAAARRYANDPNRVDQYTKHPEGWLNRDGWDDEPLPARTNGHRIPASDAAWTAAQALKTNPPPPELP